MFFNSKLRFSLSIDRSTYQKLEISAGLNRVFNALLMKCNVSHSFHRQQKRAVTYRCLFSKGNFYSYFSSLRQIMWQPVEFQLTNLRNFQLFTVSKMKITFKTTCKSKEVFELLSLRLASLLIPLWFLISEKPLTAVYKLSFQKGREPLTDIT